METADGGRRQGTIREISVEVLDAKEERMLSRSLFTLSLVVALAGVASAASPQDAAPPANAPATVQWNEQVGSLSLRYHGTVILDATIRAEVEGEKVETENLTHTAAGRKYALKDLWSGKSLPVSGKHVFEIPADGVVFLRYEQVEKDTNQQP